MALAPALLALLQETTRRRVGASADAAPSGLVSQIAAFAEPWKSLYSDSKVVATVTVFVHLAAILVAGGLAIAADRQTIRWARGLSAERTRHLDELGATHRPVLVALTVTVLSGIALFLTDVEEFAGSPIYWTKMGLFVLLLVNGAWMTRAESALRVGADGARANALWGRLRTAALLSLVLWLAVLFVGTALVNAA